MLILGIDPGSRVTGFGIIEVIGNRIQHRAHGTIKPKHTDFNQRIYSICGEINKIITQYPIHTTAIEQSFVNKNAQSALKLGQARGAIIQIIMQHQLSVAEYAARQVKATVTGYGAADKEQIKQMIALRLNIPVEKLTHDAADALAIAICHQQNLAVISS